MTLFCEQTGTIDLFETLPPAGGQCGRKEGDAQLLRFAGGSGETQCETLLTATTSLRLSLETTDPLTPSLVIIVAVDPADAQRLRMTLALLFTDIVLLTRPDIGIVIIDDRTDVVLYQPFDDSR